MEQGLLKYYLRLMAGGYVDYLGFQLIRIALGSNKDYVLLGISILFFICGTIIMGMTLKDIIRIKRRQTKESKEDGQADN